MSLEEEDNEDREWGGEYEDEEEEGDEEEEDFEDDEDTEGHSRSQKKRVSRKSVLDIAKEAQGVTEADVMSMIHKYSATDIHAELAEGQVKQDVEDVKQFLKDGDEMGKTRPGRDKRHSDPRDHPAEEKPFPPFK